MLKLMTSLFCTFALSFSMLFASQQSTPQAGPPPRPDKLDYTSQPAQIKLSRAYYILSTLVPDPQSYQLILSSRPTFGGEAFAPYVYSPKPTIIVYQGSLSPDRSNNELAFMLAHELGHLNMYHNEHMDQTMEKIFTGPPIGISGTIVSIFHQKLQERQADLYGLNLYTKAGYDLNFFPYTLQQMSINPNIQIGSPRPFIKEHSSMSMKDSHFSMKERFTLLTGQAKALA